MIMEKHSDSKEPEWEALIDFGLPIHGADRKIKNYPFTFVMQSMVTAIIFLEENKTKDRYLRIYDGFKSLLLALKTHYPTTFRLVEEQTGRDLTSQFDLHTILGRHIKLRNISLSMISRYFFREGPH